MEVVCWGVHMEIINRDNKIQEQDILAVLNNWKVKARIRARIIFLRIKCMIKRKNKGF